MKSLLQFLMSLFIISSLLGQKTTVNPKHTISGSGVDTTWVRHYGLGLDSSYADASSIVIDAIGNAYVTGGSNDYGTSSDFVTIKYNSSGDTVWVRRYKGPENIDDHATALAVDKNGSVYVTGESDGNITIKYNHSGDILWVIKDSGYYRSSLAVDVSRNVYVTGSIIKFKDRYGVFTEYATSKYNENGNTLWERHFGRWSGATAGNSNNFATSIAIEPSGNVYVTGCSISSWATIKYNADGDTLWVKFYKRNYIDWAMSLSLDSSGNVYVTGISSDVPEGNCSIFEESSLSTTIKYNSNGDTLWVRHFGGISFAVDGSGSVNVTGSSKGIDGFYKYTTIKYNTNGDSLWVRHIQTGVAANFLPMIGSYLAIDEEGSVFVTCRIDSNIVTIKYSSIGIEEWRAHYSYGAGSMNSPVGIKVDQAGNVYVGGTSSFGNTSVYTVIKYVQTRTSVKEIIHTIPSSLALEQNYPNPFNPSTTIRYALPSSAHVKLIIHDILGREIVTIVNEEQSAGWKEVVWNGSNFASGIYLVKMTTGSYSEIKKILLMK